MNKLLLISIIGILLFSSVFVSAWTPKQYEWQKIQTKIINDWKTERQLCKTSLCFDLTRQKYANILSQTKYNFYKKW